MAFSRIEASFRRVPLCRPSRNLAISNGELPVDGTNGVDIECFFPEKATVCIVTLGLRLVYHDWLRNNQSQRNMFVFTTESYYCQPPESIEIVFYSSQRIRRSKSKIEIEQSTAGCNSDNVQERLSRIEENYQQLESILSDLEVQMRTDERLKAIDDSSSDFEQTFGIKRKRKWRPTKRKSKSTIKRRTGTSSDPRKPR